MDTTSLPFMITTETLMVCYWKHGSLLSDKNHYPKVKYCGLAFKKTEFKYLLIRTYSSFPGFKYLSSNRLNGLQNFTLSLSEDIRQINDGSSYCDISMTFFMVYAT